MEFDFDVVAVTIACATSLIAIGGSIANNRTLRAKVAEQQEKYDKMDERIRQNEISAARDYATKDDIQRLEAKVDDVPRKVAEILSLRN